jgi:hypothetical protein
MPKFPEVICQDFTKSNGEVWKGCGQLVVMQKTGDLKDDGKPKYRKVNKDGSPHTHDSTKQGTTKLDDVRAPTSNASTTPNTLMLERQVATLASELEGLKIRFDEHEKQHIKSESEAMVNASDDELGEAAVE